MKLCFSLSIFSAALCSVGFLLSGAGSPANAAPQCAAGFFSTTGEEPCISAPAGYFTAGTGSFVPGAAPAGTFQNSLAQVSANNCLPGRASRGGAVQCEAVGAGIPSALGPEYNSDFGTGGRTLFGRLGVDGGTGLTGPFSFDITVTNDAIDYGLDTDQTSSDLTLISAIFRGEEGSLWAIDGFTAGMVLGEGESATFTVRLDSFLASTIDIRVNDLITGELTFRTDQGNVRGFDPLATGFDPAGIEAGYQQFRDAGNPGTLGGGTTPLSKEFTYTFDVSIPAPGGLWLFAGAILATIRFRRRTG